MKPVISIQYAASRRGVPNPRTLRRWALHALQQSAPTRAAYDLTLRVVGSAESRSLNKRWRGKDKPTNVLSFPSSLANYASGWMLSPSASTIPHVHVGLRITNHVPLGDILLCAPIIAREAREQRKSLSAHWSHMVVHGVLHLLGYDHVKDRDAKRMEAREVEILSQFGYQDPYVRQEGAARNI